MIRLDRTKGILLLWGFILAMLGAPEGVAAQAKAAAAELSSAKSLGSKAAPIKMEVFSDFQCTHCRDLYQQTLRRVIDTYVLAGKVYLVHRDWAWPNNRHSRQASRYANAAALIGKFEKVMEALYAQQAVWSVDGNVDAVVAKVLTPAEMKQVRQLAATKQVEAAIDKDMATGRALRVNSTPTLFITHRGKTVPIVGTIGYPLLKRYLDDLLRQ